MCIGVTEPARVDRSTVARELAGLFDDELPARTNLRKPPPDEFTKQRVEDDDQVTRGLISRLIDGVKGL